MCIEINIAKDFSRTPGGRYRGSGPFSADTFKDKILLPALKNNKKIIVILDGTYGYASSFLDEAFSLLYTTLGDDVLDRITFVSNETPSYIKEIHTMEKDNKNF